MNKARRREIKSIIDKAEEISSIVEELLEEIESVKGDEEEYRDNIPDNLISSERYEQAESACESLESAYDTLSEMIDQIDDVIFALEEAME